MTEYFVTVDDLYKVEAKNQKEAEQIVKDRIGSKGFEVYHAMVRDVNE